MAFEGFWRREMTLFVMHNAVLTISAAPLSGLSRDKLYIVLLIGASRECERVVLLRLRKEALLTSCRWDDAPGLLQTLRSTSLHRYLVTAALSRGVVQGNRPGQVGTAGRPALVSMCTLRVGCDTNHPIHASHHRALQKYEPIAPGRLRS